MSAYEAKYGKDTRTQFGAHMWDVLLVLERVVPIALKKAKPGTQEFREAIREALCREKEIAASQAVYNWTATDRYGVDQRAARAAHREERRLGAGQVDRPPVRSPCGTRRRRRAAAPFGDRMAAAARGGDNARRLATDDQVDVHRLGEDAAVRGHCGQPRDRPDRADAGGRIIGAVSMRYADCSHEG